MVTQTGLAQINYRDDKHNDSDQYYTKIDIDVHRKENDRNAWCQCVVYANIFFNGVR